MLKDLQLFLHAVEAILHLRYSVNMTVDHSLTVS